MKTKEFFGSNAARIKNTLHSENVSSASSLSLSILRLGVKLSALSAVPTRKMTKKMIQQMSKELTV